MSALQKGSIYQHSGFGMIEFIRVDRFHGEHTLQFRQISTGRTKYLFPHEVEKMISDQKSDKSSGDDASWEERAIKEASRAADLQAQVDELLEAAYHMISNIVVVGFSGEWSNAFVDGEDLTEYCQPLQDVIKKITGETK